MKRTWTALGLATLIGSPLLAQAPAEAPLMLAELERIALEKNPTLVQAANEVEAAKGRAKQAGLLPNPTVGYSADELPFRGGQVRGKQGVFAEQRVPLGGKLSLSRAIFEQEVREAEANSGAQRLRVVNSVRSLYYETLIAQRRVGVREDLARLSQEAVDISRQLVNVGAAPPGSPPRSQAGWSVPGLLRESRPSPPPPPGAARRCRRSPGSRPRPGAPRPRSRSPRSQPRPRELPKPALPHLARIGDDDRRAGAPAHDARCGGGDSPP